MYHDSNSRASIEEDGIFSELNQLTRSLKDLDERGLVLSLSAFAEDALGSLLKAFMLPLEASSQLLEGFNAPLGTLSSRIKAAYAMGLINKDQFHDLEHLRKIRNEFAHTWRAIDFTQQKIAAHINGMIYSRIHDNFPETMKAKIRSSISSLLVELRSAEHQIYEQETHLKVIGNHLIRGYGGNFLSQLRQANEELNQIQQQLGGSTGDKWIFYHGRLKLFLAQVSMSLRPESVDQKNELLNLQEKVNHLLLKPQN